jgi:hypothetical protein
MAKKYGSVWERDSRFGFGPRVIHGDGRAATRQRQTSRSADSRSAARNEHHLVPQFHRFSSFPDPNSFLF